MKQNKQYAPFHKRQIIASDFMDYSILYIFYTDVTQQHTAYKKEAWHVKGVNKQCKVINITTMTNNHKHYAQSFSVVQCQIS